jgi:hypothetical protein
MHVGHGRCESDDSRHAFTRGHGVALGSNFLELPSQNCTISNRPLGDWFQLELVDHLGALTFVKERQNCLAGRVGVDRRGLAKLE